MKTAIIGAGITGLYLAWKLSGKGHKVTVFEKRDKIGKEACSGLFSERILQFIPQSKNLIKNEINYVLINFPDKTVRVDFAKKFFVMSHAELDCLVADLAQKSGARIEYGMAMNEGVRVRRDLAPESPLRFVAPPPPRAGFSHCLPELRSEDFLAQGASRENGVNSHTVLYSEFDRVIGCDGANSAVRKSLSLPEPSYRLGILGYIHETRSDRVSFVETWPVKNGFIWKIPRGDKLEYGVIADIQDAKKLLDDFCRKNNLALEDVKSALVPQGFIIPKNEKITLCGDASGLTKPWSGGGVIWGLSAADLLLKNFPDLLKYQKEAEKVFYRKILFSKLLTRAAYFLGNEIPWILPSKIKIDGDKLL